MQAVTFVANCGQTAADSNMVKVPWGNGRTTPFAFSFGQFLGMMYHLATIHLLCTTYKHIDTTLYHKSDR